MGRHRACAEAVRNGVGVIAGREGVSKLFREKSRGFGDRHVTSCEQIAAATSCANSVVCRVFTALSGNLAYHSSPFPSDVVNSTAYGDPIPSLNHLGKPLGFLLDQNKDGPPCPFNFKTIALLR